MIGLKDKTGSTIQGVIVVILIAIASFTAIFYFYSANMDDAGKTADAAFNNTYLNLTNQRQQLDALSTEVRDSISQSQEQQSSIVASYYALKGITKAILMLPNTIGIGLNTMTIFLSSSDFIPGWVIALITTAIVSTIVFLILKIALGRWDM